MRSRKPSRYSRSRSAFVASRPWPIRSPSAPWSPWPWPPPGWPSPCAFKICGSTASSAGAGRRRRMRRRDLDTRRHAHLESDRPVGLTRVDTREAQVRFADSRLEPIWDKVRASERLSREDGLALFESDDLLGVGRMADHAKSRREGDRVYFVINRHITPTNVCVLSCAFCGFARKPGEAGAYEHTIEDMVAMVKDETREVHIVGGHHPDWPFEYYERMIQAIRAARPDVQIKALTAAEVDYFWRRWKIEPKEALSRLKAAGLQSMPGGGAARRLLEDDRRLAAAARQLPARRGVLGDPGRGDDVGRPALRRRRRQRHPGGRAHPAPVGRADAGGGGARAALPHDPRRRQDSRRARCALQRRENLAMNQFSPDRRAAVRAAGRSTAEASGEMTDGMPCEAAPTPNTKDRFTAKRLTRDEGRHLLTDAPLLELGARASEARFARWPEKVVTFVIDSNPNYTNVCITDCQFCAFYRKPGDREAWTLTVDEVLAKVDSAASKGATTVLLQGGHNPALPLDYYLTLVRETRKRFPQVTPHFFTASEIHTMAQVAGLPFTDILDRLWDAGQRTIPGGGAEVLSTRVRSRIAPKKAGPEAWLEVHREAHRRGFKSTATMMYGHVETVDDLLDHFDAIRELQDMFGGFTAFAPWSFKPGNTLLEKWIKQYKGPNMYLRVLAAARLYLDNFPHVQASWFSEGKPTGQIALHFGADDWGGTLFEENVHRAAEYVNTISVDEIVTLIREAGFTPAQRTTEYEIVRRY